MIASVPTRRVLGLAALVALLALAGCYRTPPPQFCGVCDGYASELTDEPGNGTAPGIDVDRTTLHVRVREDGTTRYRFRAILGEGDAATLRDSPERLERLRSEVREDHPDGNATVELDGDAVVVAYDGPELGKRGVAGVVLVDRFYETSDDRGLRLGVDRLEIRGPPGWAVTEAPGEATVEDGAVVYAAESRYAITISDRSLIAFAPDDGWGFRMATRATVARAIGTDVVVQAAVGAGPAVLGLAALVGTLLSLGIAVEDRIPVRALGAVAVLAVLALVGLGVGGVALLGGAAGSEMSVLFSPEALAVGVASLAVLAAALVGPLYADRDRVAPAIELGGRGLAGGTLAVLSAFVLLGVLSEAVVAVGLVAPAVLFLPLGYAVGVESDDRWLHPVAILLAPFGAVLPSLPTDGVPLLFFGAIAMPVWALVTGFAGLVLFFSGFAVAVDADPSEFGLPVPDRSREGAGSPGSGED